MIYRSLELISIIDTLKEEVNTSLLTEQQPFAHVDMVHSVLCILSSIISPHVSDLTWSA